MTAPEPEDTDATVLDVDDLTQQVVGPEPEPDPADEERARPSQATLIRRMALERYTFGVSEDGQPFAIPKRGPRIARPFRGGRSGLRTELARMYAETCNGNVPSASALADALTALEGQASSSNPVPLATRVAEHEGVLYLDLGRADGHVVRIGASGWQVIPSSPVLFRRTALTGAMPDPSPSGSLRPMRERLNVSDLDWPLVVAWLVSAFMPTMPHPVLSLIGEQGTGKSTATQLLVMVVDPSPAPLRSAPRDVEQWAVAAAASWCVGLDNVSGVQSWFSDVLCRAVTGDGMVRRQLYSDGDVSVLSFRRVIVTNGIDYGAVRGDLADRMLSVELHIIDVHHRRTAADVTMSDHARASVLGALLDLTAEVLAVLPDVELDEMPRMADFARVLAAVDKVMGTQALTRYAQQAADLASAVVEADPFAGAIVALMDKLVTGSWSGTGAGLLEVIDTPEPRPRTWPADGQRANAALRRVAPALREAAALDITEGKDSRTRKVLWTIEASEVRGNEPSQASQPSNVPLSSSDAAKPDENRGFAGTLPAFAPDAGAKPGEASAKPAETPAFAPHMPSDLQRYADAKPAKPAKPDSQPSSNDTCSVCLRSLYGDDRKHADGLCHFCRIEAAS